MLSFRHNNFSVDLNKVLGIGDCTNHEKNSSLYDEHMMVFY